MKKTPRSDNFLYSAVGVAVVLVVIGFVAAWLYFQRDRVPPPPFSYTEFGPIVVRTSHYAVKTKLAVQTGNDDRQWVQENRFELKSVLENTMANLDFDRVRGVDGLAYVEATLRDASNKELHASKVQKVLLTDFIIQAN